MTKHFDCSQSWSLDGIPLSAIERDLVRGREDLFYLVTAASFIEIASDLYTSNLRHYFSHDQEVVDWLKNRWEIDEMRHGRALRAYVGHVWPEFDWDRAYGGFIADYSRQCTVDALEPSHGLELVARCVVEMGTSSYYEALGAQAPEPVLAGIAARIRADEINHYKHFYGFFRKYNSAQRVGRLQVLAALGRRAREARRGDAECAIWHVFVVRNPEAAADPSEFQALTARLVQKIKNNFPVARAIKMLLKPLELPPIVDRAIHRPMAQVFMRLLH